MPVSDVDPFSTAFFADPYPAHEALREAGPVVYLGRTRAYAVVRHDEVHAVFGDPLTYCSGRGVGFTDFRVEANWRPPSLILEADPPDHARTRAGRLRG